MKINFRRLVQVLVMMTLSTSLVGAEVKKSYEQVGMWGNPQKIRFIPEEESYENSNYYIDNWMYTLPSKESQEMIERMKKPYRIPAKKKYELLLKLKKCRKPESLTSQAILLATLNKKRIVLINPESNNDMPASVRCHPHLGLLSVGTVAKLEGYVVALWDELVQGKCNLAKIVKSGDIVGFSLVITGIQRGIELAREAKKLGASCVIAGNDSAIFRDNQLLALPEKPFDAIFTSNSLSSFQQFLREFDGSNLNQLQIPEMKTRPGKIQHSNISNQLIVEMQERRALKLSGGYDGADGFIIPDLSLYSQEYWQTAWERFAKVNGHKHKHGKPIRNALGLLAQGCTRTQGVTACEYCSIFGVGDIRVPQASHLARLLQAYDELGITEFYNATDSAFEMTSLVKTLEEINAQFESLTIYARAQGVASNPKLLDRWMKRVRWQLQLNIGMDSGDNSILTNGIGKSSVTGKGSRLDENEQAIKNIVAAGANLHYSVIFGAPGESHESCKRTIRFIQNSLVTAGDRINMIESDLFWLNFGAPASKVFYSYTYAQSLAAKAGKTITRHQWWKYFGSQSNELIVPWETERAWYRFFTNITLEEAQEYNHMVTAIMSHHEGATTGRAFFPREKEETS